MSLSDKLIQHNNPIGFFEFEDVKEFIKELDKYLDEVGSRELKRLAGDKLI